MAKTNATLIWNIAELLRGPFQPNQYGDVVLPFTILRRLDCILEPTKERVIACKQAQSQKIDPAVVLKSKFVAVLQHLAVDLRQAGQRSRGWPTTSTTTSTGSPPNIARRVRRLQDARPDRRLTPVRAALPDRQGVRRRRSAGRGLRHRHGLHL